MSLIVRESSESSFIPVPAGMHLARCYRVVDLGTQKTEFQGQVKHLPKILVQFEIHSEDDKGQPLVTNKGEPMSISKTFTLSLAEKSTLRKDLSTWRSREFTPEELRGFELKNILGVWAMLSVVKSTGNNGKEYSNIASINPVPLSIKKAGLPEGFNSVAIFSISEADMELFETFSKGIKEKIQASPEWNSFFGKKYAEDEAASHRGQSISDMEDDIPF